MIEPHPPLPAVREAVTRALLEDLAPLGDMTAGLLPIDIQSSALFVSREEGVMAGRLCATEAYLQIDPSVVIEWHLDDGADLQPGAVLGRVEGPLASLLTGERTALNFLRHLSGVATLTRRFVRSTKGKATILDTRKTTPGLRALEKAAVAAGGGTNHRAGLYDMVLIKENHAALAGGITAAVKAVKASYDDFELEVECRTPAEVDEALAAGAQRLLLDNMSPDELRAAVAQVAGRAKLEASGGVSSETLQSYAETGVDWISIGALTHSAPALDLSLTLEAIT